MNSVRVNFLCAFLISCGLLGFATYLQFHAGLKPCVLCVMQRLCYIGLAIIFFAAFLHRVKSRGVKIYCLLAGLINLFGIYFAARQVWIQHQPPGTVGSCGPDFNYLIQHLPLGDTLQLIFLGSGDCAVVKWRFLSLSIAEWSLLWFSLFIVFILWQIYLTRKSTY
ncbi:MAG: disulfide bond formation protein B [Legionellales bacterium]|nr:disulfide bond formation protein B [Legionellales bacterium]